MLTSFRYPESRTVDVVEELAGVRFPDPYRWLEDESEEVRLWQTEQAELASSFVRDWPHLARLRALVETHMPETPSLPRFAGGSWFRQQVPKGQMYPHVVVSEEPFAEGRVLADLAEYKEGNDAPFLSWLSPSPDGRVLAIGVCTDGSEQNTMRLIEVASGNVLPGAPPHVLHDGWAGGAAWLPDSSGFYFLGLIGEAHDFRQAVFFHRLGSPPPTEPEDIPSLEPTREYTLIQVSPDGRWAVASHRLMNPIPIAIRDLTKPDSAWRPFVTDVSDTVAGHVVGDDYVAVTDVDAPRGRLVAIALDATDPNDTSSWADVIPASDAVLRGVTPVGDRLYVTGFEDTYSTVRVVDATGNGAGRIPLPGSGAIPDLFPLISLTPQGHPDEFLFAFSTLTSSTAIYRHRPGEHQVELLSAPDVTVDAVITDHWATSEDGTRVPYHVVRPPAAPANRPCPTLLFAYGGFNVPMLPGYPPSAWAAFVAGGGVFVHAHLRGGAEFGREWWEGGRMRNKENCYEDLYAVAEDLVANGVTSDQHLGLIGGSNGGLMCGVAVTQRPDLWKAVVPLVPLLDLIGSCRDPYDRWAVQAEFADVDDPDEVRRLARFSPYHLVRDGTRYPATLIDAGETDPRCPPWHSRKMAARLQAAQAGDAPIFVHIRENAGHGAATERSIALDDNTEYLAFLMKTLGMTP